MSKPLSVCVFGAGSIGLYLGGKLAGAGAKICFIGRKRIGNILNVDGLSLTHFAQAPVHLRPETFSFVASADDAAETISRADIILICVKSQDSAAAAKELAPHIRADSLIVSCQNGVSNAPILREILSIEPSDKLIRETCGVASAVVPFNVTQTSQNSWHCGTEGALTIESLDHPAMPRLIEAFRRSGQDAELSNDILAVQWGKLLVNLNNGLNTLWGGTLLSGLMQRDYRRALAIQIEEALHLLRQAGIQPAEFGGVSPRRMLKILRLPNFIYGFIMQRIVKIDATARSSMLDDLEAGKACEVDYLQGEVVRLAETLGQNAPINEAVMREVKAAFLSGKSPKIGGEDLLNLVK